jgi:3-oxoacyl-[acyl-carrier protein] reductase
MKLKDLKVLVTGAARGLGKEFALGLARLGASVAGIDHDQQGLATVNEEAAREGLQLATYRASVTDETQIASAIDAATSEFGALNGLINNAGIYRDGLLVRVTGESVVKMPVEQWSSVIETDLKGPFLVTREIVAQMIRQKVSAGLIVNITSIMQRGNAGQSNYSAAKAGLAAMTKAWAEELAPLGIRVAALAPGFIRTPILQGTDPAVLEKWIERVPLRRLGEPHEILAGLKFIVECDFFTGKCLEIDGGLSV